MANEMDALAEAVIETEKEILANAFGKEETTLDESGDRSLETLGEGLEGQHEADEDENEDGESEDEASEEDQPRDDKGKFAKPEEDKGRVQPEGRVPPGRLREATEKTRAAEAERDALRTQIETDKANHRKELDAVNAKLDGVLAALKNNQTPQPLPKPEEKADVVPDLFESPEAFVDHLNKKHQADMQAVTKRVAEAQLNMSLKFSHQKHGDTFVKAYEALIGLDKSNPDNIAMGSRLLASPDPGEAIVQWYRHNATLREVGDDPSKYKERIADETRKALMADPEFRKEILRELRAEAETGEDGRPRTTTRLPKSLNGAIGGNTDRSTNDTFDGSDRGIFESAFRP